MRRAVDIPDGLDVDELMRAAIEATRTTHPHPNPRVGALLIAPDGVVISMGIHEGPGTPHAEVVALTAVEDTSTLVGATAVVTLEPCSHHGQTPPCADALIAAGVSRVVVGVRDPDPRVSGAGIARLRDAGVDVTVGTEREAVIAADPAYFHHRSTGLPLVTLKLASTLDGQAAASDGTSQWITGEQARLDVHRLRSEQDAIVVGAGTVIADDPSLTVRLDGYAGPQPLPVVVAGRRDIPAHSRVLGRNHLVYRDGAEAADIGMLLKDLGSRGLLSVLVEGGPELAGSFLRAGAFDRIVWYIGGKLGAGLGMPAIGGTFPNISDAIDIAITDVTRFGPDIRVTAMRPNASEQT